MNPTPPEPEENLPRTADPRSSHEERPVDSTPQAEESEAEGSESSAGAAQPASPEEDPGTLQPQPRRTLKQRLDTEPGDSDGAHVCAPTDA